MFLQILLDYQSMLDYVSNSSNPSLLLQIDNISEYENFNENLDPFNRISIELNPRYEESKVLISVYDRINLIRMEDETTMSAIIADLDDTIYVKGSAGNKTELNKFMLNDIANLDFNGLTSMILYTQNSANNVVNKTLRVIDIIQGAFNIPVGLKTLTLDLQSLPLFTYVRIPSLDNRYYYVNSVQRYTDLLTRYTLSEDVLMTWQSLIKSQSAFVTRQADGNDYLFDNRFPLENIYSVDRLDGSIIDTPSAKSKKNCTLNFQITDAGLNGAPNFLVSTKLPRDINNPSSYPMVTTAEDIEAPDSYLPNIKAHTAPQTINYFLVQRSINSLINACMNDDTTASFIDNIMWLPFNPLEVFPYANSTFLTVYVGHKKLDERYYRFENLSEEITRCTGFYSYVKDDVTYRVENIPYLIIRDFTIAPIHENWRDYEPYTVYEVWVPFCQWVKISATDLFDGNLSNRILVYYSLDVSSGQATAYIYNYSKKYIIWSGACQMGVKLDLSLTNLNENIKQKQSNALNTALGMISSVASIAIGAASENPVAVVGGVLSASKTLASAVNTNRMILDRNSTTFGSNDGGLFAVNKVSLRITQLNDNHTTAEKIIFYTMNGKPLNKYISLSGLSGYTEIGEIHFNPMCQNITQEEINEIVAILRNGVIL